MWWLSSLTVQECIVQIALMWLKCRYLKVLHTCPHFFAMSCAQGCICYIIIIVIVSLLFWHIMGGGGGARTVR